MIIRPLATGMNGLGQKEKNEEGKHGLQLTKMHPLGGNPNVFGALKSYLPILTDVLRLKLYGAEMFTERYPKLICSKF